MIYNHNLIEKKWQKYWEEQDTYRFVDSADKPKYYALDMFPYPSGAGIHVGHLKGYLATEIISRYKKALGFDVLHPIGWDAFGLPAEQYALKTGNHPGTFTDQNINNFRNQIKKLGFCFDLKKEVCTTDPEYYRFTQWIFIKLFEAGLAEVQKTTVNWCPDLGSVLSNEEIIIQNGVKLSERGEFPVVLKPMKQWVLKITQYADKLLEGLDELDWPEGIKEHQRNWIGRQEKYQFLMQYADFGFGLNLSYASNIHQLTGVLTNEFSVLTRRLKQDPSLNQQITNFYQDPQQTQNFKLDVQVINAAYNIQVPVVLTKNLDEKNPEIVPMFAAPEADLVDPTTETNLLAQDLNKHFQKVVTYKLRDWIFSRQRYWGEPIPIVFDQHDQPHVDYNLPLILPDLDKVQPSKDGRSPLVHATAWLSLEKDGQKFTRETNTMPNWAGSCWYYVGYLLKNRTTGTYAAIDTPETYQLLKRWLPVDVYIGGQEHAVLHLLYARFWHRFLYDIGIFPTKEPFQKLFNQGMILGPDGSKMSKSKGNIVSTDEIAESHGADALRLYECFMGPVAHSMPWSESGLNAIRKWIDRVYGTFLQLDQFQRVNDDDLTMQKLEAQLIKNFESCVDRFSFNIGVSEMMVFINYLNDHKTYSLQALKTFVQILSFYAPFLGEELWQNFLHQPDSVYFATWPRFNPDVLVDEQVDLAVTVNGKFVNLVKVQRDAAEATVTPLVLADPKVAHRIQDQVVKKQVYVVNKIFNLIIEPKH